MTAVVLPFRRPPPPPDPRHGSWVVAVTCRGWLRLNRPELVYQGDEEACIARGWLLAAGAALCWSGVVYQIMPVGEFERSR